MSGASVAIGTPLPIALRQLLGADRTCRDEGNDAIDPKATSASIACCSSEAGFSPYQSARLSRYDASS